MSPHRFDIAVVGAGVFGAWCAHDLQRPGVRLALIDAFGPGNSRASSGGESRIVRMGYGRDIIYTEWAARSLLRWEALSAESGERLFQETGVLWLAHPADTRVAQTLETLRRCGVRYLELPLSTLRTRYPQMSFEGIEGGVLEPASGVVMARRAVAAVARATVRRGATWISAAIVPPQGSGTLSAIRTADGESISAAQFVFACGPWLAALFPDVVGQRIQPTRQEVFFFGPPPGDVRFAPPHLPAWIDFVDGLYGVPDLESRGVKVALDRHGPPFDPDRDDRLPRPETLDTIRTFLRRRFPDLAAAPVVESRVCQYENTSNGDFLIDRHPRFDNVWLVGGGSGHGFKHGPAVGEYVAGMLSGDATPEPRFALATKQLTRARAIF